MPQMYIPEIGDKIVLTENWTFRLFDEGRNTSLFNLLGIKAKGQHILRDDGKKFFFEQVDVSPAHSRFGWVAEDGEKLQVLNFNNVKSGKIPGLSVVEDQGTITVLKVGQQLSIDRVYIRRGASDYSSVTFNLLGAPKGSGRIRFWAKLSDVNYIVFDPVK